MLFPSSTDLHPVPQTAHRQTERAQATSRTTPNLRIGSTSNGQQERNHRNSTHQTSSGSLLQNPRVNDLIKALASADSSPSSQLSSPTGNSSKTHDTCSSLAPSSSLSSHQSSLRSRPQVPVFPRYHPGSMSHPGPQHQLGYSLPQGSFPIYPPTTCSKLTTPSAPYNMSGTGPQKGYNVAPYFPGNLSSGTSTSSLKLISSSELDSPNTMPCDNEYDLHELSPPTYNMDQACFNALDPFVSGCESVETISPELLTMAHPDADEDQAYHSDVWNTSSTALSYLPTPGSFNHDSFTFDSTDPSPALGMDLTTTGAPFGDFSLFPETEPTPEPSSRAANPHVAPEMSRNGSSPGTSSQGQTSPAQSDLVYTSSRQSIPGSHSFTAGVKARRNQKPLPLITVDPSDAKAVKRAKNTMAARTSRANKVSRYETMVARVADLESKVEYWKNLALKRTP